MGQRHQIYVVLPYTFAQKKSYHSNEYVQSNIVAIHHQWLYSFLPITRVAQFARFYEKHVNTESTYGVFLSRTSENPENAVAALISFHWEKGVYSECHFLENEFAVNPLFADNNDGITIIDLREKGKFKYCFMFLNEWEGEIPGMTPLSARGYLKAYFDDYDPSNPEWPQKEVIYIEAQIEKVESLPLLTLEEVKEIFPAMYVEKEKEIAAEKLASVLNDVANERSEGNEEQSVA